jgi:type II secretory pathway component PulJ
MTAPDPAGRAHDGTPPRTDAGTTLVETVMSTLLMAVVLSVVTAGLLHLYRLSAATDSRSVAQTQVSLALQRLDRQLRYAAALGAPENYGGVPRIAYLVTEPRTRTCYQVRLDAGRLQQRRWAPGQAPAQLWTTIASDITGITFHRQPATDEVAHQRLTVTVSAGAAPRNRTNTVTYTALNSSLVSSATPCSEALGVR